MPGETTTRRVALALWLLLPAAILLALSSGAVRLGLGESVGGLISTLRGDASSQAAVIIGQIRLPRALLAGLVGAILAMSGAAMQGLFRNPLADPSLIGVTAGASLGASLAIVSFSGTLSGFSGITLVSTGAFVGGLLAVILVYRLATSPTGTSVATMLLAGIAITALAGAVSNV
ncbi:MAG: FecCD family ABC transporter permease, partial [Pseudomonadales bacterium]